MCDEMSETVTSHAAERLEQMQTLMDEILEIQQGNDKSIATIQRVQEIIKQSNDIVEPSVITQEMIIDAKILHAGTQVVSSNVSSFDTNLTAFNLEEYQNGIMSHLMENSMEPDSGFVWNCLEPLTYSLYKKSTPISYMLGAFALDPPPKKERPRIERRAKVPEAEKKVLTTTETKEVTPEEDNSDVYKHIFGCLWRKYKQNNRDPVNYFKFIIDPESYWRTVENLFHFSFLVRDDMVKMSFDSKKLPVIEPLPNGPEDQGPHKKNQQFCFRISQQEWQKLITVFDIRSPAVTPFNKKN